MSLTEEQQRIIKAKDKYMMVIAGAGCGKTFTILKRVEYLINELNVNKESILIISFTNNTVNDIKKKIKDVDVLTFHKLAIKLLGSKVNKLITDYDLKYYLNEYFLHNLTKHQRKYLKYYLDSNDYQYFIKRMISLINIYKANNGNLYQLSLIYLDNIFNKKERYFIKLFYAFLKFYTQELNSFNGYDFNDLIIKASSSKNKLCYQYIIVDEFQDTSLIRLNLLKKLVNDNNASLMVVGDDYQSIYQFSGSNLNIFLDFNHEFNAKTYYLTKTFRNSYELVNVAGLFIMKNRLQIKKSMLSDKHLRKPIIIYYFQDLKNSVNKIITNYDDYMILGRNHEDNLDFNNFYTVHASKGLESEVVIIINNQDSYLGFPNKINNDKIASYLINFNEINYAEERRLFYVALTRSKNEVYLMVKHHEESIFIKELIKDYHDYIVFKEE
ncbi:MAG: UvrD-helicase domain-containing protein [Bacilli bacterium]|nr:UvrD-helicase domain-containing protein [Bacilli bacterium]